MRINSERNPYTLAYINNNSDKDRIQNINNRVLDSKKLDAELKDLAAENLSKPDKIISTKERNFFKEMFPDSSNAIENHVLFTRNGSLQNLNLQKGSIVDGKI